MIIHKLWRAIYHQRQNILKCWRREILRLSKYTGDVTKSTINTDFHANKKNQMDKHDINEQMSFTHAFFEKCQKILSLEYLMVK